MGAGRGCHAFAVKPQGSRHAGFRRENMTSLTGGHAFAARSNRARRLHFRPRKHGTLDCQSSLDSFALCVLHLDV
jgi:hypothetical protein